MRNASDIFCLKELKDGDTTGTEMFSVNGQCHLTKLSRRRLLHKGSSSFEYGSATTNKPTADLAEVHNDANKFIDDAEEIKEDFEELHLGEEGAGTSRSDDIVYDNYGEEAGDQIIPEKKTSPTKKKSPVFRTLNPRNTEDKVSESAMLRNPLTGAGIEVETHRKPKKGPKKNPKWTW